MLTQTNSRSTVTPHSSIRLAIRRSSIRSLVTLLALPIAVATVGCGSVIPDDTDNKSSQQTNSNTPPIPEPIPVWKNSAPELLVAPPNSIQVGDAIPIIGSNFVEPQHGHAELSVKGTYFASDGYEYPVNLTEKAYFINKAQLTWHFFPNIRFHPGGNMLGYFLGEFKVTNIGNDGSRKISNGLPVKLEVQPSLIVTVARPRSSSCAPVTTTTIANDTPYNFGVEAVGFGEATGDNPLLFRWTFLLDDWKISSLNYDYNFFDTSPDVEDLKERTGPILMEDEVTSGTMSVVEDNGNRVFVWKFLQDLIPSLFGRDKIRQVRIKAIRDPNSNSLATSVAVAVFDTQGRSATINIPITAFRQVYADEEKTKEIVSAFFQPEQHTMYCTTGSAFGSSVSYREDHSISEGQDLRVDFNAGIGINWGLPQNPFALGANANFGFGRSKGVSVNSSDSVSNDYSVQVIPGYLISFYRQKIRKFKIAPLIGHTECGRELELGTSILTTYTWSHDAAQAATCPPKPNLEKPRTLVDYDMVTHYSLYQMW